MKLCKLVLGAVPLRIERSEEEQFVLEAGDVSAHLSIEVIVRLMAALSDQIELLVTPACLEIINLRAFSFKRRRCEVSTDRAVELISARFGDDLNDTAGGFAVLRFESAGFYLHFFYEA